MSYDSQVRFLASFLGIAWLSNAAWGVIRCYEDAYFRDRWTNWFAIGRIALRSRYLVSFTLAIVIGISYFIMHQVLRLGW